jgi:hypothetical protein
VIDTGLSQHGLPVRDDSVARLAKLHHSRRAVVHVEKPHRLESGHGKAPQSLQEPRALGFGVVTLKLGPDRF